MKKKILAIMIIALMLLPLAPNIALAATRWTSEQEPNAQHFVI